MFCGAIMATAHSLIGRPRLPWRQWARQPARRSPISITIALWILWSPVRDRSPTVYFNPREGHFKAATAVRCSPDLPSPVGVYVFDFNKDGWMDVAVTHRGAPGVTLWRNVDGKRFERVPLPIIDATRGWGMTAMISTMTAGLIWLRSWNTARGPESPDAAQPWADKVSTMSAGSSVSTNPASSPTRARLLPTLMAITIPISWFRNSAAIPGHLAQRWRQSEPCAAPRLQRPGRQQDGHWEPRSKCSLPALLAEVGGVGWLGYMARVRQKFLPDWAARSRRHRAHAVADRRSAGRDRRRANKPRLLHRARSSRQFVSHACLCGMAKDTSSFLT